MQSLEGSQKFTSVEIDELKSELERAFEAVSKFREIKINPRVVGHSLFLSGSEKQWKIVGDLSKWTKAWVNNMESLNFCEEAIQFNKKSLATLSSKNLAISAASGIIQGLEEIQADQELLSTETELRIDFEVSTKTFRITSNIGEILVERTLSTDDVSELTETRIEASYLARSHRFSYSMLKAAKSSILKTLINI